jgi:hypothetical protein
MGIAAVSAQEPPRHCTARCRLARRQSCATFRPSRRRCGQPGRGADGVRGPVPAVFWCAAEQVHLVGFACLGSGATRRLSVSLPLCLSLSLSLSLSLCLSASLWLCLWLCFFVNLSVSFFVFVSVCLSVFVSLFLSCGTLSSFAFTLSLSLPLILPPALHWCLDLAVLGLGWRRCTQ